MLSEDYAENASQVEQIDSTANGVLHSPSNECLPRSNFSSIQAGNPPVDSFRNRLYGRALSLDNQSDGQTFHHGATWDIGTSDDLPSNLQPTPSSGNVDHAADVNVFSWPFLGSDSDWQIDLDMALTAEATNTATSASSNALTELDMCQSFVKSPHGSSSVDSTGELSEYLKVDKKVRSDIKSLAQNSR